MLTLGIMGSGSGSNFQAILDAIAGRRLDARVALVLSDQPDAYIIERAKKNEVDTELIDCDPRRTLFPKKAQSETARLFMEAKVDLICLAGFMRLVKAPLLEAFPERILNIHPSLLPAFPGMNAWDQAIEARATKSGCTVHLVDAGMDTGPILAQAEVPISPGDTGKILHERIQAEEHQLYPKAIGDYARRLNL